jgi:hypothetical protein
MPSGAACKQTIANGHRDRLPAYLCLQKTEEIFAEILLACEVASTV